MYDTMQRAADEQLRAEAIKQEKIRRAMLAGPACITTAAWCYRPARLPTSS